MSRNKNIIFDVGKVKKYYFVILRTKCGKATSPNFGVYSKPS